MNVILGDQRRTATRAGGDRLLAPGAYSHTKYTALVDMAQVLHTAVHMMYLLLCI